ncbi:DegT/DnrJ/EryC1/StrS family aminotransferase [Actinokineospora auranticolor]|uniref:L-glutamine:2-deoxy-scyllo-inosose/3-amino-2, 3-dideoxy-scyllo-inosose aminotransferase n=1 Tax=Actinokineospora auranticolor TaxID=155976 RepID=A0A2S6GIN0_9PSEU|nr:DegT/DnrJ/EryC1/StrS family aminotransferase [Actinokineospora auranticolor]PPK65016.1 L-glutamine:2-deoxy-scyllo-inosose/3-amino-2,3-dideoxy-scyllo-inosose aminotransferase [Actinokineospora auranticolor]
MSRLALHGGPRVRADKRWARWPQYDTATEQEVVAALRSGRWAISWPSDGTTARERRFAEDWARYNDVPHCVSVDHGSSALLVALEALDIGPGDEVIVPTMTWVAPVTAVLRVGALPVLADVDPVTGCVTPETIAACRSGRTKAIIVVHLGATVADLDGILAVAGDVPVVEDCAQAHGARWRGRNVGTYGALGVFSFQNGKVLAAGEGGAVITSDPVLYRRAQQLRADSRRYPDHPVPEGTMELVEDGEVMGANYCMSELSAAVLLDQLPRLDTQHLHREKIAGELERGLAELGGFGPIPVPEEVDRRSIYEYGISYAEDAFGGAPAEKVAEAITAELGFAVYPPDPPLNDSVMLRPFTKRRFAQIWSEEGQRRAIGREFPGAERFRRSALLFHHGVLLGDSADAADIVAAVAKVRDHAHEL